MYGGSITFPGKEGGWFPSLQADVQKNMECNTYSGNKDSIPTPATILLILNVVLSPALRLAITIPFIIETRLLFSGTSYHIRHNKKPYNSHEHKTHKLLRHKIRNGLSKA